MKFNKIYVEITNACNLNCSFCSKTNRKIKSLSIKEFETIMKRIDNYTDYIYLHIKGEPLLHKDFHKILLIAKKYNKHVNITTNGTLLKEHVNDIIDSDIVRQINISLHCDNSKDKYLVDIFDSVDILSKNINIVYRFWTLNDYSIDSKEYEIINQIISHYNLSTEIVNKIYIDKNISIAKNIYINKDNKFIWPDVDNDYLQESGYCYALNKQLGILSDGTVVPCCLDCEGVINLGNIFNCEMKDILSTEKVDKIINGFRNRKVSENLCKHCSFKGKFD